MNRLISALKSDRPASISRAFARGFLMLTLAALALANLRTAQAHGSATASTHDAWRWHWDESTLSVYRYGSHRTEAIGAANAWNSRTDLTLRFVGDPREAVILLWGQYYGDTGWAGLNVHPGTGWDWHCWSWCRITMSLATYNTFYRSSDSWYVRKVFCHELGHAFGLAHNWTGGCMHTGYRPDLSNQLNSHDVQDVNQKY